MKLKPYSHLLFLSLFSRRGCWFLIFCAPLALAAESYPTHPIRLLVPAPPGGTVDLIARLMAPRLSEQMGKPIVVDNRSGAGGMIHAEMVANAPNDGYTIAMIYTSYTTSALLHANPTYSPLRDNSPLSQVSWAPLLLVAYPGLAAKTVGQLITLAKSQSLLYGSAGNGSGGHMAGELFNVMAHLSCVHVPYKGAAMATNEVVSGQVAYQFAGPVTVLSLAHAGRLRLLAATSLNRANAFADLPTLHESGVTGFDVTNWFGLVAPPRLPVALIQRLNKEIKIALTHPSVKTKLESEGSEIVASAASNFADFIKADLKKWDKLLRLVPIKVD